MNINNKSLGFISSVFAITMTSTNPVAACDWLSQLCCGDSDGGYSRGKSTSTESETSSLIQSFPSSVEQSIEKQKLGLSTPSTPIKKVETEKRKSEEEKGSPNLVVTEHKESHISTSEPTPTDQSSMPIDPNLNHIVAPEISQVTPYYDSFSDTDESSEAQPLSKHQEAIVSLDLKDQVSPQIWNHLADDKPLSRSLLSAIQEVDLGLLESKSAIISIALLSNDIFKLKIGSTPISKIYSY